MDLYEWLWMRIGGRPWTYIARDFYHKFEYGVLVSLFVAGFWVGHIELVGWKGLLILLAIYTLGFIHGHFFWGSPYLENQQGS